MDTFKEKQELDDVLSQTPVPSLLPLLRYQLAAKLDHAELSDGRVNR